MSAKVQRVLPHVSDNKSRVGIKGQYQIQPDLTLLYQVEFGVDLVDQHKASNNFIIGRDAFIGLKSQHGTLFMGRMNTPFKKAVVQADLLTIP